MKTYKATIVFSLLFLFSFSTLIALESTEKIKEDYAVLEKDNYSEVFIKNIFGSLTVESYNGKTLLIEATKTITAYNQDDLERGKSEIDIKVHKYDRGLFIYFDHPCANFDPDELEIRYDCGNNWNHKKQDYKFNIDISIKVPKGVTFIDASTVNNGEVFIEGLACDLDVSNVNGSIMVENHVGNIRATTVNGDVDISFTKNPESYAKFSTINGKIKVECLGNLSAKVKYETMHGDFYTNYDDIDFLPAEVKKTESRKYKSAKYKLGSSKSLKIGNGETEFSFNTLNGDIYLTSK